MSFNQSGTFVYSPDISVAISTLNNGVLDVSADIMNFQMNREINQTSTFTMTLNNPRRKYNRVINTMDRITVFLKRTKFVQCFTGLVTYAPIETLVPTPVTIQASCTLYILQQTYWDDTLITYQSLLLNYMDPAAASTDQTINDGGVAQALVNVLTQVCGWNQNSIHIQGIPYNFLNFAAGAFSNSLSPYTQINQGIVNNLNKMLSGDGIVGGKSVSSNSTTFKGNKTAAYLNPPDGGVGINIDASKVVSFITNPIAGNKANFPGPYAMNPVKLPLINEDIYYCSAPFSYASLNDKTIINNAMSWLAENPGKNTYNGRLLLLTNQSTQRVVAVRATSLPQKPNTQNKGQAVYDPTIDYFQCHPGVVAYLNGSIGDPTAWKASNYTNGQSSQAVGTSAKVTFEWADSSKITVGVQPNLNTKNVNTYYGENTSGAQDPNAITKALNKLIHNLRGQIGDAYTESANGRSNPGAYGSKQGSFDCSGIAYWGYSTIGIKLGGLNWGDTWTECGPTDGSQPEKYGQWIPNTQQPQAGDLMFWEVPKDGGAAPQHVTIMSVNFGEAPPADNANGITQAIPGVGYSIQANAPGVPLNEVAINWSQIVGGQWQNWGGGWKARLIGCRRPIILHPGWGSNPNQNYNPVIATNNTNSYNTPNSGPVHYNVALSGSNSAFSATGNYNTLFQAPNWNVQASILQGTPQGFILDNPVMQDITQIIAAGLRVYQSAPNGDFVAWFPDYYGVYGTQPSLDISPVEIIDFQIYHDDTQLVTHVAVIGDTTGIGQSVTNADQINTQGIVSIQDVSTMQILFGKYNQNVNTLAANQKNVQNFLNRYGIRPSVSQQSVIHSNSLEYIYALQTFMQSWVNQFTTDVQLTFMPELYPGMRISMTLDNENGGVDNYEFYVVSVQHQGDRTGGFSTSASLTAPIKNGEIMHYGLNFVS